MGSFLANGGSNPAWDRDLYIRWKFLNKKEIINPLYIRSKCVCYMYVYAERLHMHRDIDPTYLKGYKATLVSKTHHLITKDKYSGG